jgi:hypothetical protein
MQVLSTDKCLQAKYLRCMTKDDTRRVMALHKEVHGVPGMLGSIDCMHVPWKNCPYEWQGTCMGKSDSPTIIIEAACDYNLWFWHASVGYPGALNDINVFDLSTMSKKMVDGTLEGTDIPFIAGNELFLKNYYLADGIYPPLARLVKTIPVPIDPKERCFQGWQEACRKDIERGFGVLVRRFMILSKPMEIHKIEKIKSVMYVCILLHNMLVEERTLNIDDVAYLHELDDTDINSNIDDDNGSIIMEAEGLLNEEIEEMEHRRSVLAEHRALSQNVVDAELQMLEHRDRYLTQAMQLVRLRYDKLYDQYEHKRLQDALVNEVYGNRQQ